MEGFGSFILIGVLLFLQLRPDSWWNEKKFRTSSSVVGIVAALPAGFVFFFLIWGLLVNALNGMPIAGLAQTLPFFGKWFIPEVAQIILGILIYLKHRRVFQAFWVAVGVDILYTGYALIAGGPSANAGVGLSVVLQIITYVLLGVYLWRMRKLGFLREDPVSSVVSQMNPRKF